MVSARIIIGSASVLLLGIITWFMFSYFQFVSTDGVYKGTVSFGFETSGFTLCQGGQWWVSTSDDPHLYTGYRALAQSPREPVYVELKGTVSQQGSFGHMSAYPRELHVYEVVKMSTEAPKECHHPVR